MKSVLDSILGNIPEVKTDVGSDLDAVIKSNSRSLAIGLFIVIVLAIVFVNFISKKLFLCMPSPWISIVISSIAFVGGVVSHYFVIRVKIAILETKMERAQNDIVELKKHIPLIETKVNESHTMLASLNAKFDIAFKDKL